MRRYAPFRGRHSVSYMPLATWTYSTITFFFWYLQLITHLQTNYTADHTKSSSKKDQRYPSEIYLEATTSRLTKESTRLWMHSLGKAAHMASTYCQSSSGVAAGSVPDQSICKQGPHVFAWE
ncbi:hypothetical protein TNCV_4933711 [Trichonephila clavipes]|nr:hypothetical protein TNCV_4933711 [Trichonephila clavipes]